MATIDQQPTRSLTRRQALAALAGATAAAATGAGPAAAETSYEEESLSGVVLSKHAAQGDRVDVLAYRDTMQTVPGKQRISAVAECGDRPFVAGDRVSVSGDEGDAVREAEPLYIYLNGIVEQVSASSCTVGGTTYQLDAVSSYLWWSRDGSTQWRSPAVGSPACKVGTRVGAYAIENVELHTSTIYVMWLDSAGYGG
jgi:hypothetical protein